MNRPNIRMGKDCRRRGAECNQKTGAENIRPRQHAMIHWFEFNCPLLLMAEHNG
jgi:hypothetical protein